MHTESLRIFSRHCYKSMTIHETAITVRFSRHPESRLAMSCVCAITTQFMSRFKYCRHAAIPRRAVYPIGRDCSRSSSLTTFIFGSLWICATACCRSTLDVGNPTRAVNNSRPIHCVKPTPGLQHPLSCKTAPQPKNISTWQSPFPFTTPSTTRFFREQNAVFLRGTVEKKTTRSSQ
ncbi:hypothetical protein GGR57DRAFT_439777 [Xylariaceae sp. FL1272]|nr:hypothetical protein GGR57DRAFT_439777 [Xylariaceae sp. FL1272]